MQAADARPCRQSKQDTEAFRTKIGATSRLVITPPLPLPFKGPTEADQRGARYSVDDQGPIGASVMSRELEFRHCLPQGRD